MAEAARGCKSFTGAVVHKFFYRGPGIPESDSLCVLKCSILVERYPQPLSWDFTDHVLAHRQLFSCIPGPTPQTTPQNQLLPGGRVVAFVFVGHSLDHSRGCIGFDEAGRNRDDSNSGCEVGKCPLKIARQATASKHWHRSRR